METIGLTQINRLERGFATVIETNTELDLWNAARSKVADVSVVGGVVAVVSTIRGGVRTFIDSVSTGVTSLVVVVVVSVIDISGDETTLIIENRIIGIVGGDTKDGIESVSLKTGLNRGSRGSGSYGIGASATSGGVGFTIVHELVAHETGDNVDILSRAVAIGFCVKSTTDSIPHGTRMK